VLPDSLRRRPVGEARLAGDHLRIVFTGEKREKGSEVRAGDGESSARRGVGT
jgi:hypothetical protein